MSLRRLTRFPTKPLLAPVLSERCFSNSSDTKMPRTDDDIPVKKEQKYTMEGFVDARGSGSIKLAESLPMEEFVKTKLGKLARGLGLTNEPKLGAEAGQFEVAMPGIMKADIEVSIVDGQFIKVKGDGYQGPSTRVVTLNTSTFNVAETKAKMDVNKGAVVLTVPMLKEEDLKNIKVVEIPIE